jgi:single-stranded-DNA-specific exonuclease
LRDLLPDPRRSEGHGRGLPAHRARPAAARERIAVFADYDVDGGSSAALLIDLAAPDGPWRDALCPRPDRRGLRPERTRHGRLAQTHDLIVCVDCGTLSHGPIAAAKGADVIVLDHHLAEASCPTAWPW